MSGRIASTDADASEDESLMESFNRKTVSIANDPWTDHDETKPVRSIVSSRYGNASFRNRQSESISLTMPHSYRKRISHGEQQAKYLFFPWSKGYKLWLAWTVGWSLLTAFFEPYSIGFLPGGLLPPGNPASIIEYCFMTIFAIDLLVNFNLAYTDENDLVLFNRKQIAWQYLQHWFWIDLTAVFPFYPCILAAIDEIGVDSVKTRNLKLVRFLRLLRLHRVVLAFEVTQYSTKVSLMWYTVIRNFGGAIMWFHCAACVVFFIARQNDFTNVWLEQPAETDTNFDLYLTSMYWSVATFTSLGYGDIPPSNVSEQIFGMIYVFLSMVMMSWIFGSITLLFVKNDVRNGEYRNRLRLFEEYAALNNFDEGVQKSLKAQLKLDFSSREISDENVLQHFPGTIRRKVIRHLYFPIFSETNLMKNARQTFVDSFLTSCSVELFGPNEELLQRGTVPNDLYLLVDGTIQVTVSTSVPTEGFGADGNSDAGGSLADSENRMNGGPVVWEQVNAGDFVNDISFFTESPSAYTVRTMSVCKTLTMPKAVYKAIAKDHPWSVSIILESLLAKARKTAATRRRSIHTALSKRMEYPRGGSRFDLSNSRSKNDLSEAEVDDTIASAQAEAALTSLEDLITTHLDKLKDDHTTKFLFAASRGDIPTLRLMLNHGIDPDSTDYDRRTALMVASMNGRFKAVALLLEYNANPNMQDVHGTTALHEAVKGNHEDCMHILKKNGGELCLFEDAAAVRLCQTVYDGDMTLLSRFCKAGININAGDYDRRRAMHIAASEGNMVAMRMLVEFGGDISWKDRRNQSIEDEAKNAKTTDVLEYLQGLQGSSQNKAAHINRASPRVASFRCGAA